MEDAIQIMTVKVDKVLFLAMLIIKQKKLLERANLGHGSL